MAEFIFASILIAASYFYFVYKMAFGLKKENVLLYLPEKQENHLGSNIKKLPEK